MVKPASRREQKSSSGVGYRTCCYALLLLGALALFLAVTENQSLIDQQISLKEAAVTSSSAVSETTGSGSSAVVAAIPAVSRQATERNFYDIGVQTGTDKVLGPSRLSVCLNDQKKCVRPDAVEPKCRTGKNHYYHTMYQKWLGPYSRDDTEPFQLLEIGM